MNKKNSFISFFKCSLFSILFFCYIFINTQILDKLFTIKNLSFIEFDNIEFFKIIGYVSGSVFSIFFLHSFSFLRSLSISAGVNFLCFISMMSLNVDKIFIYITSIFWGASFILIILIFFNARIQFKTEKKTYKIINIIFEIFISYILTLLFSFFTDIQVKTILKLNIVLFFLFYLSVFLTKFPKTQNKNISYDFNIIIQNMELECLIAFSIFFLLASVENSYEIFAISNNMYNLSSLEVNLITSLSVVTSIFLFKKTSKVAIHKTNIICLCILFLLFLILPLIGKYIILLISNLILIITTIILFFVNSIFILIQKFKDIDFTNSLAIYGLGGSIGYYCGYITSKASAETLGVKGFLISISFLLLSFFIYYLYFLKKFKLYK